ncbi:hypothetical protein [Caenibacillus caldisaponilyticus]|nr:hypothetical protein [Caenibacillus caldisaponilyticus]
MVVYYILEQTSFVRKRGYSCGKEVTAMTDIKRLTHMSSKAG